MDEKRLNTGVTVLPSLHRQLTDIAHHEDKTFSRLCEVLLRWCVEQLEKNRITSIELKTWHAVPALSLTQRISRETQEQLLTAVEIILRDAPSAQVEAVVGYLTRIAGKYGKE